MAKTKAAWLDADEAVETLGVSRATLYAYVSRGRIRSEAAPGAQRRRRYSRDDIERLKARSRERRNPEKAAEQALHWGLPILESAITLIADEHIYYRGHELGALARERSVADVAALLWTGTADAAALDPPQRATTTPRAREGMPFIAAAQSALALASADDALAYDLRPRAVAQTGWRIVWLLTKLAAGSARGAETVDATLAAAWGAPRSADLIRAALIACADHELNVSTFTARCVASAGASPYNVTIAGLAALEGTKHGGATARVDASWDALRRTGDLRAAFAERLRRGEVIEGFGHPLYPGGDPRASLLLAMLPKGKPATFARELVAAAKGVIGEAPTVDFALVALARALGLPSGSALTLFAIGRTIGWIGHAIEQYEANAIIRPRAKYVGATPVA
ncbi:MAG TPA: citrate synthase family protein [Gammaproteobacteria bacterium]